MELITFLVIILVFLLVRNLTYYKIHTAVISLGMVWLGIDIFLNGLLSGSSAILNPFSSGEYASLVVMLIMVFGSIININGALTERD